MQSKSLQTKTKRLEVNKQNKSYEFVKFYEPSEQTNIKAGNKHKSENNFNQVKDLNEIKENVIKNEKSSNKKKQKIKNNSINISSTTSSFISDLPLNDSQLISTPKVVTKKSGEKLKSIMKIKPVHNDTLETTADSATSDPSSKRKKRNKSVSYMLDDTELLIKKSKSDASQQSQNEEVRIKKLKKNKPQIQSSAEKENESTNRNENSDLNVNVELSGKPKQRPIKGKLESIMPAEEISLDTEKRKKKKPRKPVKPGKGATEVVEPITNENEEQSTKKMKKTKRQAKPNQEISDIEEPANKSRKKINKPDLIAESLGNLNIGDNQHTLTDLIDKMTVVDKNKKKKRPKKKQDQIKNKDTPDENESKDEVKEKVKWVKKKWNKGRRDFMHEDRILTSVIIENLPLRIMLSYKNILAEHFSGCGQIRQIGIAELYPADSPKPIFNTTILFDSEEAATKALEEDNTLLEGNRIRVKHPLPYNQTTIVVRSYAELTEQTLSTMFSSAGCIRKIKQLVKGKKISSTAFIEFDSPEAVERAIKAAEGVLIKRKKVHVFKFQDQYGAQQKEIKQDVKDEVDQSE